MPVLLSRLNFFWRIIFFINFVVFSNSLTNIQLLTTAFVIQIKLPSVRTLVFEVLLF